MLENMFTTKMSMDKKSLQQRFSKIRSNNGKVSKIIAIIVFFVVIAIVAASAIYVAVRKSNENEYAMSDEDFAEYISNPIGSDMAEIDYADENKIVFHYGNGFFVTNEKTQEISYKIDLNKLNISIQSQGDTTLGVNISSNGKYAYLLSYGQDADKFDKYVINLNNGSVKKGEMPKDVELFGNYIDTYTIDTIEGWSSIRAVKSDDKIHYLNLRYGEIGNIRLVTVGDKGVLSDTRYIFGDEGISSFAKRENVFKSVLSDGEEIVLNSEKSHIVGVKEVKAVTYILSELTKIRIFDEKDGAYEIVTCDTMLNKKISPRIYIFNQKTNELIFTDRLDLTGHYSGTGEFYTKLVNTINKIDNNFNIKQLDGMNDAILSIDGKEYSPKSDENLASIEKKLSAAKKIKMGGTACPFDAELIILDKNNQVMRIELATDSCAVFKAGAAYYDYSDGDNKEFFSLFGVDVNSIRG